MYVNPFWMGVLVTIVVEIIACIVYAMMASSKGGKK
jgi:hypothetical protein